MLERGILGRTPAGCLGVAEKWPGEGGNGIRVRTVEGEVGVSLEVGRGRESQQKSECAGW